MALKPDISAQLTNFKVDLSTLKFRITSIALPEAKMDWETSDYFNDANILAVTGYKPEKVHFCYLIGDIPGGNVPDPNKHRVFEWHYNELDEDNIEDNAVLPKAEPSQMHGFCSLALQDVESRPIPASPTLASGNFPEQNPDKGKWLGTPEGGVSIGADGQVEIISGGKGVSFKAGDDTTTNLDLGDAKLKSTNDGFTNWLLMKNPFRDGSIMGAPMPNVLPLFPLEYDPFPNIPSIVQMYLRMKMYKELIEGIGKLGIEFKKLKKEWG